VHLYVGLGALSGSSGVLYVVGPKVTLLLEGDCLVNSDDASCVVDSDVVL